MKILDACSYEDLLSMLVRRRDAGTSKAANTAEPIIDIVSKYKNIA